MSTITNTKSLSKNLRQIAAIAEDLRQKVNDDQGKSNEEPMKDKVAELEKKLSDLTHQNHELKKQKQKDEALLQQQREARPFENQKGAFRNAMANVNVDGKVELEERMSDINNMHGRIQKQINQLQTKTNKVLQDQERDLMRAFKARLVDMSHALEKEKKKNRNGSVQWVAKCQKLAKELEWFRTLTDQLTAENKNVLKENRRYKRQLKTQEEDREFLIKQLVSVKKENARLRYSFDQANFSEKERERIGLGTADTTPKLLGHETKSAGQLRKSQEGKLSNRPLSGGAKSRSLPAALNSSLDAEQRDGRYQIMIRKLQTQLDRANNKHRALKSAHTQELASRTVLQNFLKKCIEDVRVDIAERRRRERRQKGLPPAPVDPRTIPLEEFTPADRINVMEWLLSQDHVIYLLYEKMFPRPANDTNPQAAISGGLTSPSRMSGFGGRTPPRSSNGSPFRDMNDSLDHSVSSTTLPRF